MSPEYAMEGKFSEKSDVYSFGVLLLEIVSGKRNTSFRNDDHSLSLVGFVSLFPPHTLLIYLGFDFACYNSFIIPTLQVLCCFYLGVGSLE